MTDFNKEFNVKNGLAVGGTVVLDSGRRLNNSIIDAGHPTYSNTVLNLAVDENITSIGGTANVITGTVSSYYTNIYTGSTFNFKATGTNTSAVTLEITGLSTFGAIPIKKLGTQALVAGDILTGQLVNIMYDGTNFQMISPTPPSSTAAIAMAIALG